MSARHRWDVPAAMRDGVSLAADVYLPAAGGADAWPALLSRTPYSKQLPLLAEQAKTYAEHGYAVVLQDVRGRHESDGEWVPFRNEGADGYDTIEWIARQPWCDGKVGTFGGSYGGWFQWAAARERPPHLAAMVSTAAAGRWMQEAPYDNGMVMLVMLAWLNLTSGRTMKFNADVDWEQVLHHLPLRTMDEVIGRTVPAWREYLDNPTLNEYWKAIRLSESDFARIDLPVLHITGWYDEDQPGALFFYEHMVRHSPAAARQAIRLGPWDHGGTRTPKRELGGVDFSPAAVIDMDRLHLEWFDRWLKGDALGTDHQRADYFVTGTNEWCTAGTWPPSGVEERSLFLASGGKANTLRGDGSLQWEQAESAATDVFTYDPADPVVSAPSFDFYGDGAVEPQLDRRYIARRDDVLVYTSAALQEPLTVVGRPWVTLFGSSDCPDTDWVAAIHDVHPDGRSILLSTGRLRARYRESLERAELMTPGQVYEFTFELFTIGHVFRAGHRLRLTVTSSDFPAFDRNLNTGNLIADDAEMRIATNSIHHGGRTPSRLLLPIGRS